MSEYHRKLLIIHSPTLSVCHFWHVHTNCWRNKKKARIWYPGERKNYEPFSFLASKGETSVQIRYAVRECIQTIFLLCHILIPGPSSRLLVLVGVHSRRHVHVSAMNLLQVNVVYDSYPMYIYFSDDYNYYLIRIENGEVSVAPGLYDHSDMVV